MDLLRAQLLRVSTSANNPTEANAGAKGEDLIASMQKDHKTANGRLEQQLEALTQKHAALMSDNEALNVKIRGMEEKIARSAEVFQSMRIHPVNTPSSYSLLVNPVNKPCQYTLLIHPGITLPNPIPVLALPHTTPLTPTQPSLVGMLEAEDAMTTQLRSTIQAKDKEILTLSQKHSPSPIHKKSSVQEGQGHEHSTATGIPKDTPIDTTKAVTTAPNKTTTPLDTNRNPLRVNTDTDHNSGRQTPTNGNSTPSTGGREKRGSFIERLTDKFTGKQKKEEEDAILANVELRVRVESLQQQLSALQVTNRPANPSSQPTRQPTLY